MSELSPLFMMDVGNTVISWGLSRDALNISEMGRVFHEESGSLVDRLQSLLMGEESFRILVASVNPEPLENLEKGFQKAFSKTPVQLLPGENWHPEVAVDHPREVGVDRLLNARALKERAPSGGIVVDHGTALTIDYVGEGGVYSGGLIVPGIKLSMKALAQKTALIPAIDFQVPRSVIGKNTAECLRAGLYFGLPGLVETLVRKIREEKGNLPVFVTGGNAEFIMLQSSNDWSFIPDLTLQGLLMAGREMRGNA
jgi:type III pantothenate kinase